MEYVNKSMIMDSKIYKPPVCRENSFQAEQEEITEAFTMVIETDNYIIEIEIG